MNNIKTLLLVYLAIINLMSFFLFGIDKRRSKNRHWRIPESTLLGISFFGGSLGSILGMSFFRHKTKKRKFTILIPISLFVNIYILFTIFDKIIKYTQ